MESERRLSDVEHLQAPDGNEDVKLPLQRWLWRSYLRSAIIPLLVIELTFLAIFWACNAYIYRENVATVRTVSGNFLSDVARRESLAIGSELEATSRQTTLFARQTLKALDGSYEPPAAEKRRYGPGKAGGLVTRYDNGGTASFYSNVTQIGPEQLDKVWRLAALDPLMIDIASSSPQIGSIYVNTWDSYNRIYPYFDVEAQYAPGMRIPSYNFYYEADAAHNPQRKTVWTDAYIDPAGHGWMVSSIAPVWRGSKLEAVVGIDVTLKTIIERLNGLDLPWDGYAILVDRKGGILALPPDGEQDFGLRELTSHRYSEAIMADTFKPDTFNINKRADTRALAEAMRKAPSGDAEIQFDGAHTASFSTIAGPGWRLVVIAPNSKIYADAEATRSRLRTIGFSMMGVLFVFYAVFFVYLAGRARAMSARVAAPLAGINELIDKIGAGDFRQVFGGSRVSELDDLGHRLVETGEKLAEADEQIQEQERIVTRALARQTQINDEMVRFVRIMSHELRTPLSVIDSSAQIIDRKAGSLEVPDLKARSQKVRGAVRRISDLLQDMVRRLDPDDAAKQATDEAPVDVVLLLRSLTEELVPAERRSLDLPEQSIVVENATGWGTVLRTVIDNAARYSPERCPVRVSLTGQSSQVTITITDEGPGISAGELEQVGERFFRGTASTGTMGLGVGLYVARKLAQNLGGNIEIVSDGGGTTVVIQVPVASEVVET
jgi:signal transduction histidine kinase